MVDRNVIHLGDCQDVLSDLPEYSVDAVVTDPPYGMKFMSKKWDYDVPNQDVWGKVLRVLKSGGYLLCFAGARTYHRMACEIESAGFEIRDQIMWIYGSGFPKSHNISKGIDKAKGAKRPIIGISGKSGSERNCMAGDFKGGNYYKTADVTDEAIQWNGWGTALKPAHEPIVVARKPLEEKTIVDNVLRWGTGGINIDECRILNISVSSTHPQGRWPANVIHDGSEEVMKEFDKASRFFYCAKASKAERGFNNNNHPTVKPIALIKYLIRLITPPGGIVLDPFIGSGTTALSALDLGVSYIGIEKELKYWLIAMKRIEDRRNEHDQDI